MNYKLILLLVIIAAVVSLFFLVRNGATAQGWRFASHEPTGTAPDPQKVKEAVIQIYSARTWGWRGNFATHPWIAVKPTDGKYFTVYEKIGWRLRRGETPVVIHQRPADARWYGNVPELLADLRGSGVDAIIAKIDKAAHSYPHVQDYSTYPGPNSNTFIAHIGREVPELKLDLPPTAIGKDYLGSSFINKTSSGTGFQFSLGGLLGILASWEVGLEINILGLVFGIDPIDPAIKLPFIGRIGPAHASIPRSVDGKELDD